MQGAIRKTVSASFYGAMVGLCSALLVSSCDSPGQKRVSETINDGYPPLIYQGDGEFKVRFVSDVTKACRQAGLKDIGEAGVNGCTILGHKDGPIMILQNPCKAAGGKYVRNGCHEIGHANGWPPSHD